MSDLVWTVVIAIVMIVALAGVIIPVLPGLVLMWAAALGYGFAVGFGAVGISVMVLLSILTVLSVVLGLLIPRRAAAESGASTISQIAGLAGAVIGFVVIPFVGLPIGALVGVLLAEYLEKGDWALAREATIGMARGFGLSVLVQFSLGMVMLLTWSIWALTVVF